MSNFNQNEDLFNESLLNLYDEQFKYSAFKIIKNTFSLVINLFFV